MPHIIVSMSHTSNILKKFSELIMEEQYRKLQNVRGFTKPLSLDSEYKNTEKAPLEQGEFG